MAARRPYQLLGFEQFCDAANRILNRNNTVSPYPTNDVRLMSYMYLSYRKSGLRHSIFLHIERRNYVQNRGAVLCEPTAMGGVPC